MQDVPTECGNLTDSENPDFVTAEPKANEQNFTFEKQNSLSVRLLLPSRSHFLHSTRLLSFLTGRPHFCCSVPKKHRAVSLIKPLYLCEKCFYVQRTTQTWAVWALFFFQSRADRFVSVSQQFFFEHVDKQLNIRKEGFTGPLQIKVGCGPS